mgnify:FL=1
MSLTFTRMHPYFFAAVSDVDLASPFGNDILVEILNAFAEHSVLLFRNQTFDDDSQIAFSQRIGPLEKNVTATFGNSRPEISKISNVDTNGKVLKRGSDDEIFLKGNSVWHTDSSFKVVPALGSALSAREVPPVGGETEFADMRAAYDLLDEKKKQLIQNSTAVHSFAYSQSQMNLNGRYKVTAVMSDDELEALPPVQHPMIRVHPESGRKAIYVGRHASHIVGLSIEEGRALIRELNEFSTQPEFVYRHKWQTGDLVMWDNRMVMHRGLPYDPMYKRVMHRTTVAGHAENNPWVIREKVA